MYYYYYALQLASSVIYLCSNSSCHNLVFYSTKQRLSRSTPRRSPFLPSVDRACFSPPPVSSGALADRLRSRRVFRRSSPTLASFLPSIPSFDRGHRCLFEISTVRPRPTLDLPPSIPASTSFSPSALQTSTGLLPFVPALCKLVTVYLQFRLGLSPFVPILGRPVTVRPGRDWGAFRCPSLASLVSRRPPRPRPGVSTVPHRLRSPPTSAALSPPVAAFDRDPSLRNLGRLLTARPRLRPGLLPSVPDLGEPLTVHPRPLQACCSQPSTFAGALAPRCRQACRCSSPALTEVFVARPDTGQTFDGSTRP